MSWQYTVNYILIILFYIASNCESNSNIIFAKNRPKEEINCEENKNCFIHCTESNSCIQSKINCPINHQCNITCNTYKSCNNLTIYAQYASLFILNINQFISSDLTIYFPPKYNNGSKRVQIYQLPNNQKNKNYIINPSKLHFYAINGWNDININIPNTYNHPITYGTMHCLYNNHNQYTSNCDFSSNSWQCMDRNHICNTYSIQQGRHLLESPPTNEPTSNPVSDNALEEEDGESRTGFMKLLDKAKEINILWYIIIGLALIICCISICCLYYCHRTHKAAKKLKKLTVKSKMPPNEPTVNTVPTFSSYTPSNTAKYNNMFNNTGPKSPKPKESISAQPCIQMGYNNNSNTIPSINNKYGARKSNTYDIANQGDYDQSDESAEETQEPVLLSPKYSNDGSKQNSIRSMDVDDIQISPAGSKQSLHIDHIDHIDKSAHCIKESQTSNISGNEHGISTSIFNNNFNAIPQNQALYSPQSWQQQMNYMKQQRHNKYQNVRSPNNYNGNPQQFWGQNGNGNGNRRSSKSTSKSQSKSQSNYANNNGVAAMQQRNSNNNNNKNNMYNQYRPQSARDLQNAQQQNQQNQQQHPHRNTVAIPSMSNNQNNNNNQNQWNQYQHNIAHRNTVAVMSPNNNSNHHQQQQQQQQPQQQQQRNRPHRNTVAGMSPNNSNNYQQQQQHRNQPHRNTVAISPMSNNHNNNNNNNNRYNQYQHKQQNQNNPQQFRFPQPPQRRPPPKPVQQQQYRYHHQQQQQQQQQQHPQSFKPRQLNINIVPPPPPNRNLPPPPSKQNANNLKHITSDTLASINTADDDTESTESTDALSTDSDDAEANKIKPVGPPRVHSLDPQTTYATGTDTSSGEEDYNNDEEKQIVEHKEGDINSHIVPINPLKPMEMMQLSMNGVSKEEQGNYMKLQPNLRFINKNSVLALDNQPSHSGNDTMVINIDGNNIEQFNDNNTVDSDDSYKL